MKNVLLLSMILSLAPVALAQDTTNTGTPDTTIATPVDPNNDGVAGTNTVVRDDNNGFPWGLLGLIGLAGLAGLNRRPATATAVRAEPHNDTRR